MKENRVKISSIVESQLPSYVREEFPLIGQFLSRYYRSQEYQGGSLDIIQNIDEYIKRTTTDSYVKDTYLTYPLDQFRVGNIYVESTEGFPDSDGLIRINDEIIYYRFKTDITFETCIRGFSGTTSFDNPNDSEELVFDNTVAAAHEPYTKVENLTALFLDEFLRKTKKQLLSGLSDKELFSELNQRSFIKNSKSFYSSRGTDKSFEILFKALYGKSAQIIRPIDSVITPSDANYRIDRNLIVEVVEGDPENLLNRTLFQDEFENIRKAYAPISSVEKIHSGIGTEEYYKIAVDGSLTQNDGSSDLLYGDFSPHPKTYIIGNVEPGQSFIDVDTTVGFPVEGTLTFQYANGTVGVCTYSDKTINQFLNVDTDGITSKINDGTAIDQNTFAFVGNSADNGVRIKIRSVLHDVNVPKKTYYQKTGSKTKIKTLGKRGSSIKENSWLFNSAQYYDVESLVLVDAANNTYKLTTKDNHVLKIGDVLTLTDENSLILPDEFVVTDIFGSNSCLFRGTGITNASIISRVTRKIRKVDSNIHTDLNSLIANVQNVYLKPDGGFVDGKPYFGPSHEHPETGERMVGAKHTPFPHATIVNDPNYSKVLVASSSLPSDPDTKMDPKIQKFTVSGTFVVGSTDIKITDGVDHNLYTGDKIIYTPQKGSVERTLPDGTIFDQEYIISSLFDEAAYFVKRVDANTIKLARSRANIHNGLFVEVEGSTDTVTIKSNDFELFDVYERKIEGQQLLREVKTPYKDRKEYETMPGYNGMLINGVEVLNYKSTDICFYGELSSISVTNGGEDYDVINPPVLGVTDSVGTGATGFCGVEGNLKEIRVIDSGFDYLDVPIIKISGGAGEGATAEAKMVTVPHNVTFDSSGIGSAGLGTDTSTIGFSTTHKFRNGEKVVYKTFGKKALVGLNTDATYYVNIVNDYTLTLHKNLSEASVGIGTVTFTDFGEGFHSLNSLEGKSVVSSINVTNSGSGYKNRQTSCVAAGVNTALNLINIKNHGYNSGEILKYTTSDTVIGGLTNSSDYYVTVLNEDQFKLSAVGVGSTQSDFYYTTKQYQNLDNIGSGKHSFNYQDITVSISGNLGISSIEGKSFAAQIQPIIRGEVTNIFLENNGVGYGVTNILNYERPPLIDLNSGRGCEITPVVTNGRITDVIVSAAGTDYNTAPEIKVLGIGTGAVLIPELNSTGNIISVNIANSGAGYGSSTTSVDVVTSGKSANFKPNIQRWTVNKFRKTLPQITPDDVFIDQPLNRNGLQCGYVYAPRPLRSSLYGSSADGKILFGKKDLTLVNGAESTSDAHSPIIGWAYDGNPIYGPYGYTTKAGGSVTQMKSGYTLNLKVTRPPTSEFPPEFFVEDFLWLENTDESFLDKHNGRFCVTPEYPNGTYAYFATVDSVSSGDGIFKNFKQPKFPYLIGNSFYSTPNEFNYNPGSRQDRIDLNETTWTRNTFPYSLEEKNSGYSYVKQSYKEVEQESQIKFVKKGSVDFIGILTGGQNHQVGDEIVFEKQENNSFVPSGSVTQVSGQGIGTVSVNTTTLNNVEFYRLTPTQFLGIHTSPHGLLNNDIVTISGLTTTSAELRDFITVGVNTTRLQLTKAVDNIGATGIVTYFSVIGDLNMAAENDIFKIGNENVRILNVDRFTSRIRVLRQENSTVGTSHTESSKLEVLPRKVSFNVGINTVISQKLNKEYYFNPAEAVGLSQGTSTSVGIGTTLGISNPGSGKTQIFVETRRIFLPNHGLRTGDVLTYQTNGGSSIGIATNPNVGIAATDPDTTLLNQHSSLFVANLGVDFIGLSTVKIGIGTTGSFVGVADTTSHQGLIHFLGIGTGTYHSFKTTHPVIKGKIEKNQVTVSTAGTHGLLNNDTVTINVNPENSTSINVLYNRANRKSIVTGLAFTSGGITTAGFTTTSNVIPVRSSISLSDHGLENGQKVIHISESSSGGLETDTEYFVYVVDKDTIQLTNDKFEVTKSLPNFVAISTAGSGEIYPVNPPIKLYKNSIVNFNLSDNTLSYTQNATTFPAFDLKFYTDENFINEYLGVGTLNDDGTFDVTKTGTVGVTTDAKVTLRVKKDTPETLYYRLSPIKDLYNLPVNREISEDRDSPSNKLIIQNSKYNGQQNITVSSDRTFTYEATEVPEASSYNHNSAKLSYTTNSETAFGSITEVTITNKGAGYEIIPGITTITSSLGSGALLEPASTSIGKVESISLTNIGFDYSSDRTLRPTVKLPQTFRVEPLTGLESVGVTSVGRGYNTAPSLVVLDGKTKKKVEDIKLRYTLDTGVEILQNTNNLSDVNPTIIPVGNPNGIRARNFTYDDANEEVTVTLKDAFSTADTFPLEVGDKVLVENVSVGIGSTALGFNSENYDYIRFEITEVFQNLSSVGVVTYSMAGLVGSGQTTGRFNAKNSSAVLVRERDFPQFDATRKSNVFDAGESVNNGKQSADVFEWDDKNKYLTVESSEDFAIGDIIKSDQTGRKGLIKEIISFETTYDIDYYSIVDNGWEYDKGFLNKESQRIHDNEYYQSFSYSVKSEVPIEDWEEVVSQLNHAAGFKKFASLDIESNLPRQDEATLRPITDQSIDLIYNLDRVKSVNCVENFDLVSENYLRGSVRDYSDEISFSTKILQDYAESVGNRVLTIDDISGQFNNNARTTKFEEVFRGRFANNRAQKFVAYIRDRLFTGERQIMLVNAVYDTGRGFAMINQYGSVHTAIDLGSFDASIEGAEAVIQFFPNKFELNNYDVKFFAYNIDTNVLGVTTTQEFVTIGSTTIGESTGLTGGLVSIASSVTQMAGGAETTIVTLAGIGTTVSGGRSAKILVNVEGSDGSVEYDELTVVHDGTNVQLMEYGQLTIHSLDAASTGSNIGTFGANISGNDLRVTYTPIAGMTTAYVNTITVGLSSEGYTGIGTYEFAHSSIEAKSTTIPSTSTPVAVGIASYSDEYDAAYVFVQVSDTTNGRYEVSEVMIIDDYNDEAPESVQVAEYGNTQVGSGAFVGLGTISGRRASDGSNNTELTFTPDAGANIEVKTYMNAMRPEINESPVPGGRVVGGETELDFGNASLENSTAIYTGTQNTVKRSFNLQHKTLDIFRRVIDGSSTAAVDISNDTITIPDHFFVTGEELVYEPSTGIGTHAIGIARTTFVGVGSTTQLPSSVFVIKQSDSKIKLARSAEDALKAIAVPLNFTSVGVGTSHSFTAKNQNQKVILSIDNIIQSPVAGTSVTTALADDAIANTELIKFVGLTSFFGADYIRVGPEDTGEIMKILGVGIGSTNAIKVQRGWLGTPIVGHDTGAIVTKLRGGYNIVDNYVNFAEAPNGLTPVVLPDSPPDSRDWTGIVTSSSFNGRVFTRSGVKNSAAETYSENYLYDDIAQQFTGKDAEFSLTTDNGTNVTGVATNNAVVLINNIFQGPGNNYDYNLTEVGGISSIRFTGTASSVSYDPNNANIPVGGVIVSVGSSEGFGYQPLVSAGGTAIVSAAGTIASISIGNTGSGYRSGIQTVNVSIQREKLNGSDVVAIGTAAISNGHITGVAVTDGRVFYVPRDISNVGYSSITGITTITTSTAHGLIVGNEVVLSGIAFTCDYAPAVGVQSAVYNNVTGIMTVTTIGSHGLSTTGKNSDVLLSDLGFNCALGPGIHTYPRTTDPIYCGASVIGVASATQFTINAGVSTVPTFFVSGGIAQPVLIAPRANNNSASGQDPAYDGTPVLRVLSTTDFEVDSGISTRAHNYARCGKVNQLLKVIFDAPHSYTNIPLQYSEDSPGSGGLNATIDVVVGQGSSVIDFSITNTGYGYGVGQVLTIPSGGATGIPTTASSNFEEFKVDILEVDSDTFVAWSIGQLQVLDDVSPLFDGVTKTFPISANGNSFSIQSAPGSLVKVQDTLLLFVNDILQVPEESYFFTGGSNFSFEEAPKAGDTFKLIFYRGTGGADVVDRDIIETVKTGDDLTIGYSRKLKQTPLNINQDKFLQEDARTVSEITSSSSVDTNPYSGGGISDLTRMLRPVTWCRQTEDRIVAGKNISKARDLYNARIFPSTHIIKSVGIGSTIVSVDNVKPFFNAKNENKVNTNFQKDIVFVDNPQNVGASATAVVGTGVTVTSIVITDGGKGYTSAPSVTIQNPVGLGTTSRATATATISGGSVTSISVDTGGIGYAQTTHPRVLIGPPTFVIETNTIDAYSGDFGIITGIGTTSIAGVAVTGLVLDLVIPSDSFLRDATITQPSAISASGIATGDLFVIRNSNVGHGVTSLDENNGVVGVGTSFMDGVYRAAHVTTGVSTDAIGFGLTTVTQVVVSVNSLNGLTGLSTASFYGEYSWGKLLLTDRNKNQSYTVNTSNGITGIETGPVVIRQKSLKVKSYST